MLAGSPQPIPSPSNPPFPGDKSTSYNQIYDYPDSFQYRSPRIHSVIFTELEPNTTYFYRVRGGNNATWSPEYNFTTLPAGEAAFPLRLGLIGDGGQTYNSSATYEHLLADNPQVGVSLWAGVCRGSNCTENISRTRAWFVPPSTLTPRILDSHRSSCTWATSRTPTIT